MDPPAISLRKFNNGAPFDLYFSADISYPKKLEEAGLAVPGSLYPYAIGRIVLWAGKESHLDLSKGLEVLREPTIKKIAIANPKHAPYGRAAVAAMEHVQVYERVKDKLVLGENISQAAQFVESGAADVGIIALSLALASPMQATGHVLGDSCRCASTDLEQGAVILKGAKNQEGAKAFLSIYPRCSRAGHHETLWLPRSITEVSDELDCDCRHLQACAAYGGRAAGCRIAHRVLAHVLEMAMEVHCRVGGRVAACAASDGAGFLYSGRDRPA